MGLRTVRKVRAVRTGALESVPFEFEPHTFLPFEGQRAKGQTDSRPNGELSAVATCHLESAHTAIMANAEFICEFVELHSHRWDSVKEYPLAEVPGSTSDQPLPTAGRATVDFSLHTTDQHMELALELFRLTMPQPPMM